MLERWIRTASCAVLALVLAAAVPAAADDANFTVSDVHVDVTAASALAAKDQAQAQGQAQAFDTLMTRLGVGKPHLTPAQITDLVLGFEVANERTSTVRYVADYTFQFNPAAVRRLLGSAAMATAEPPKRPLIVLPILTTSDGRSDLWDDPNPWRDAWTANGAKQGLASVTVPDGDLPDVAAIDAPKALAGDRAAIRAIAARYNNGDVLVAQGKFGPQPGRFEMQVARYSPGDPAPPRTLQLMTTAKPGESETQQLARSVGYVIAQVAQTMKTAPVADAAATMATGGGTGGTIDATLASGTLGDWVTVRNRLRDIAIVRGAQLLAFDRSTMRIAIRYLGDPNQLRAALGAHGLALGGADPNWTLALQTEPLTAKLPSATTAAPPAPVPATPTGGDQRPRDIDE